MKNTLPLLLASSLVWHAAAWADEWTNIATAVTVTEGRLCAGELAADGTGTDILCDTDHPSIDSSGNVVVSGEVSATTLNAAQLCDEDGANCRDLSDASAGVSALASLTDVTISSPVSNALLLYNGTTEQWEAKQGTGSAFMAYGTATLSSRIFTNFSTVAHNDGDDFNNTTGVYTVPQDGSYLFMGSSLNSAANTSLYITVNGDYRGRTYEHGDSLNSGTVFYIDYLSAGATVALRVGGGGDIHTNGWHSFGGYLIGPTVGAAGGGASVLNDLTDVSDTTPTEGQLLSYDAGEGEWVARTVVSETIILNSADDNPCVVTGGVRKLSFNPSTGRLRVCRP